MSAIFMPSRALSLFALPLLAVTVVGTGHALAQKGHEGHERYGGKRQERVMRFCANDTARYQPAIRAFVKADLKLTDAQAREFDTWSDIALPGLEDVKATYCAAAQKTDQTPPDRITSIAATLRKGADLAERLTEPTRKFYASLNDEQKKRFDSYFERRSRWGFPMRMMGGMGRGYDRDDDGSPSR